MPGGGKSTVGRQLSKRLNCAFFDSDAVIEKRLGTTIKAFFETHGEQAFRDIEAEVVAELATGAPCVLATGGGVVLRPENRKVLAECTDTVYLRSTPEELYRRLRHDTQRPLLQVKDPLGKLRELFAQRDPLYDEVARFKIETGRPSVPSLVNMLLMQLELAGVIDPDTVPSSVQVRP